MGLLSSLGLGSISETSLAQFFESKELLPGNQQLLLALVAATICFGIQLLSDQFIRLLSFYELLVVEDKPKESSVTEQKSSSDEAPVILNHADSKNHYGNKFLDRNRKNTVKSFRLSRFHPNREEYMSQEVSEKKVKLIHIGLDKVIKLNMIAVSMAFSIFATFASQYAIHLMNVDPKHIFVSDLVQSRMNGCTRFAQVVLSVAQGYFIWDLITCLWYHDTLEPSFLIHAVVCLAVYTIFARGTAMHYAVVFLSYETSTPFMNWRNILKLVGSTKSLQYPIVSLVLMGVFLYARIYRGLMHYFFAMLEDMVRERDANKSISEGFYKFGMFCNMILNGLNVYWFSLMCMALFKKIKSAVSGTKEKSKSD